MTDLFHLSATSTHSTSREDFVESWLQEMPMGIPSQDYYPHLVNNIQERKHVGLIPEMVTANLYKFVGPQLVYYVYQTDDKIILATELSRKPQALVVNFTAKSPHHQMQPPWASDLYIQILEDGHTPMRLVSDESLTNEGLKIWQRLLAQGATILVYDKQRPGTSGDIIRSESQLLQ